MAYTQVINKYIGIAAIGGSVGALAGMYTFRHKTKQKKYTITVPMILIIQIIAAILLLSGCGTGGASYTQISQDEAMQMMKEEWETNPDPVAYPTAPETE